MSERAAIRTSKKECVECWSKRIKETEVGTDWDLATMLAIVSGCLPSAFSLRV